MQNPLQLRLPTSEYRVLPYPTSNGSRRAKIATCFVRALGALRARGMDGGQPENPGSK